MKKFIIVSLLFLAGCGQTTINTIGTGYGLAKVTYKLNTAALNNKVIPYNTGLTIFNSTNDIVSVLDTAWDLRTTNDDQAKTIAQKAVQDVQDILTGLNKLGVK